MTFIAISGPAGSGKDTAAEYIADQLGFKHVSGGDVIRSMLKTLGLEPTKSAVGDFGTFLRTHYGADAIIKEVIKKAEGSKGVINSGLRSPSEAQTVKASGGFVWYVDAETSVRHQRMMARQRAGDKLTPDELKLLDAKERSGNTIEGENLNEVRALADLIIENNGSLDAFHQKLDAATEKLRI